VYDPTHKVWLQSHNYSNLLTLSFTCIYTVTLNVPSLNSDNFAFLSSVPPFLYIISFSSERFLCNKFCINQNKVVCYKYIFQLWEGHHAVRRRGWKRDHGHQKKTRSSLLSLRSMAMEAGVLCLQKLVIISAIKFVLSY